MSLFLPALPVNARIVAVMDNLLAIAFGLAVRSVIAIVSRDDTKMTATLVGIWEGVVLSHFLKKMRNSFDPHIGYGVRLFFDYFLNDNVTRLVLIIVWTGLGVILADIVPALWVDVGLHRFWRRFRRDIYYMSRSMPKVDIFPRARTVRFSPRPTTAILSDPESTVAPSIVSTTQAPTTTLPLAPARITSKRHVPGSFESDLDTNTEPGSVPSRQRDLPAGNSPPAQSRRRQSIFPSFTPIIRDNVSEVTSAGHDVDDANISSPASEGLTEDISAANPNEIPDELELEYIDTKPEPTPKQHNAGLPTPTDSAHPFDPMRQEEDYVRPPPPADIRTIPDTYDAAGADGWEKINKGDAGASDGPPPPPEKESIRLASEKSSSPPQPVPPPATHEISSAPTAQSQAAPTQHDSTLPDDVKRGSILSDKPPSYQEPYEFQELLKNPLASTEHGKELGPETTQTEQPLRDEQVQPEPADGADEDTVLSDLSETTLMGLEGNCLDQMAKLHQLITKAREAYEIAVQRHKSVQTSGNKSLGLQAKADMSMREKRLKKLTNKAEACYLAHNGAGQKFAEEVDLSALKDRIAMEGQVQKALEIFLRPSIESTTLRFLCTKGKPGNLQKDYISNLATSLSLTSRKDTSKRMFVDK